MVLFHLRAKKSYFVGIKNKTKQRNAETQSYVFLPNIWMSKNCKTYFLPWFKKYTHQNVIHCYNSLYTRLYCQAYLEKKLFDDITFFKGHSAAPKYLLNVIKNVYSLALCQQDHLKMLKSIDHQLIDYIFNKYNRTHLFQCVNIYYAKLHCNFLFEQNLLETLKQTCCFDLIWVYQITSVDLIKYVCYNLVLYIFKSIYFLILYLVLINDNNCLEKIKNEHGHMMRCR